MKPIYGKFMKSKACGTRSKALVKKKYIDLMLRTN
jgi:hypothetical protein